MDCSVYCKVFWIGIALLPVAGIAGKVLALMGYGKQK